VGLPKNRQELEASPDEYPDGRLVDQRIGLEPTGKKSVVRGGSHEVERTEDGDSPERAAIESVEALRSPGMRSDQRDGVRAIPQDHRCLRLHSGKDALVDSHREGRRGVAEPFAHDFHWDAGFETGAVQYSNRVECCAARFGSLHLLGFYPGAILAAVTAA
jgi:hypothetical protein